MNKAELKEKLNKWFKGLPEKMKDALYPEDITCDICGDELVAETRYHLCAKCTEEMPFIGDHICLDCGVQIDNEADYCDRCPIDNDTNIALSYTGKIAVLTEKISKNKEKKP